MPDLTLDHDTEGHSIPIPYIKAAIESMTYASTERVMFQMLYYTGCRLTCLDRMFKKNLYGEWLYWQPGKNQRGFRKERLTTEYLEELGIYWNTHRVTGQAFFGVTGETFRGYFKNIVRPKLPSMWQRKRPIVKTTGVDYEYVYQLKGLRKNFQSLDFKRQLDEWGDPGIAIEMTSKRMCHSSTKITARHYVENFRTLGINELHSLDPAQLLKTHQQKRLLDFL